MKIKSNEKTRKNCSSIQIWYESALDDSVDLELDINLWRLDNQNNTAYFDLGLKIHDSLKVARAYVYFPFVFDSSQITDLGDRLKDLDIVKGVFNEEYSVHLDRKHIVVQDTNTAEEKFRIYRMDSRDLKVENDFNGVKGTVVSFAVSDGNNNHTLYYRFRIKVDELLPFIEHYQPKNSFFESAFIETEMIDVRINEKRNQDDNLIEHIAQNKRFILRDVHFFVMTSLKDDVVSDGKNLVYKRQLEMGGFWKDYLEDYPYGRMSVYKSNNVKYVKDKKSDQASKSVPTEITDQNDKLDQVDKSNQDTYYIEDFDCFARVNYRKCNKKTIVRYSVTLLVSTIALTFISEALYDIIKWLVELFVNFVF